MAINTIKATIQMRRGLEQDFDADQMTVGEWAVSTDKKYVRMCFAPGIVVRMATYEAFEQDMKEIQNILETCQDIQTAVDAMAKLAEQHVSEAQENASQAYDFAKESKSYAMGGTGIRTNEDIDNSKYYYEQTKTISERLSGVLRPMGTVTFADLPALANASEGDMYNIYDQFTTNADFKEGAGNIIPAGANVYKTADEKWDVLAGTPVSTVNGQTGDVTVNLGNITGVLPVEKGGTGKTLGRDAIDALITFLPGYQNDVTNAEENAYMILQDVRMQNRYLRKPIKAIVNYIKSKLSPVAATGDYNDLLNAPDLTPDNIGALSTNGGTMNGNIDMTGHHIISGRKDIDFDGDSFEFGIREQNNINYWDSHVNIDDGVINIESTNIDLIGGGARLKISDTNFLLGSGNVDIYSSNDSLHIDTYNNIDLVARNEGHINLTSADEISFFILGLSNKHLFNISSSGRFELLAKNGINIESGNNSIYIKMPNNHVFEIKSADMFRIYSNEYKLYCHPEDYSQPHEFFRISKSGKTTVTPPKAFDLSANNDVRIASAGRIDLIPGTNSPGEDHPSPNSFVRIGNIKGLNSSDGTKPNITGFGNIECQTVNGKPLVTSVNGQTGDIEINSDGQTLEKLYKKYDSTSEKNYISEKTLVIAEVEDITDTHQAGDDYDLIKMRLKKTRYAVNSNPTISFYADAFQNRINADNMYVGNTILVNLGDSSNRWNSVYASTGTIQTSDRTQKNNITSLDDELTKRFIMGLIPSSYGMVNGTSGRTHWGLIAQDIEELMENLGMESKDFAGFIKSPKVRVITEDENGNLLKEPIEEVIEGEYDYSLRYDEFTAPHIKMTQMQQEEIDSLKETVQEQEEIIQEQNEIIQNLLARLEIIEQHLNLT